MAIKKRTNTHDELVVISQKQFTQRYKLYPLISLQQRTQLRNVIHGLFAYSTADADSSQHERFTDLFAESVESLFRHGTYGNPEQLILAKERINILLNEFRSVYSILDTYGCEPLQTNYGVVISFLDLYAGIDEHLRIASRLMRRSSQQQQDRTATIVRHRVLAATVSSVSQLYAPTKRIRRVPITQEGVSIYSDRAKKKHEARRIAEAHDRQRRRITLTAQEVPMVRVLYYTTKRGVTYESDRELLQRVGQWSAEYEQWYRRANDQHSMAGFSTSKSKRKRRTSV